MWPELEPAITSVDSLNCTVFIPISIHPILISRPERWCQVCWWLIDWLIDELIDELIDWLIHWSVEWLWIDFSSILTRHSAQDAEDSDSSVELDTVDYRNEAWSLGLMIIACICMHYRPFFNPDVPNIQMNWLCHRIMKLQRTLFGNASTASQSTSVRHVGVHQKSASEAWQLYIVCRWVSNKTTAPYVAP